MESRLKVLHKSGLIQAAVTIQLLFAPLLAPAADGFWTKDASWERRAHLQRKIYVSARTERTEGLSRLGAQAMGIVAAPISFTSEKAKAYEDLPKISAHFKTAQWDEEKEQLFIVTEALGWQARMVLKLSYDEDLPARKLHQFEVESGSFKGLKGDFTFVDHQGQKTQLILNAEYANETLPLPRVLMGVALEVIMEQVAQKLRRHLERSYQASLAKNP